MLARGQGLRSGLSEDAWQWRLDLGRWQTLLPGVAVTHSGGVTERQRAWAALLYAGSGAVLTGLAALRLDGLTLDAPVFDVLVPAARQVRAQPSAAWQRSQGYAGGLVRVRAHRVADAAVLVHPHALPPRQRSAASLVHAAAWAPSDRAAETYVAAAVQQGLVTVDLVRAAVELHPRLRRRALVRLVLDEVESGAQARGELDLLRLLRQAGLPRPDALQRAVRGSGLHYLDAWWERQRVVVEVDGGHHRLVGQWEADLTRSNDLVSRRRDVVVLRFTNGQVRHEPARVVAQLTAVLCP